MLATRSLAHRLVVGLVGAMVAVLACSKSQPTGAPAGDSFVSIGTPAQFPPAQPGYLDVVPPALALTVGQQASLTIRLFDSTGIAQPAPPAQWSSSAPSVVTVDAAGNVTARGLGGAEITGTDNAHGPVVVSVSVVTTAPTDPIGVVFTPPILYVDQGASATPSVQFTGASGAAAPAPPTFALTSGNMAVVAPQGSTISGSATGLSLVGVQVPAPDGNPATLSGSLLVGVLPPGLTPATASGVPVHRTLWGKPCTASAQYIVEGCITDLPPARYWAPGLSDTMRNYVVTIGYEGDPQNHCGAPIVQVVPPDAVQVPSATTGVVTVGPKGTLDSVAPGSTIVEELVFSSQAPKGGPLLTCSQFLTGVLPDMSGAWTIHCDGTTGSAFGGRWLPTQIDHHAQNHDGYGGDWIPDFPLKQTSCYASQPTACDSASDSGLYIKFPGNAASGGSAADAAIGVCGPPPHACPGVVVTDCGAVGPSPHALIDQIVGPDTLTSEDGACTLSRGGTGTCADAGISCPPSCGCCDAQGQCCAGCCDAQGSCQPGLSDTVCGGGVGGAAGNHRCVDCTNTSLSQAGPPAGQTCHALTAPGSVGGGCCVSSGVSIPEHQCAGPNPAGVMVNEGACCIGQSGFQAADAGPNTATCTGQGMATCN